jgi:predicted nucleic acid-binding protein
MKVLFDTNVLIDVLAHREPFYGDSRRVVDLAASGEIEAFVGAGSIADIHYVVRKHHPNAGDALALIADLVTVVRPVDTAAADVLNAIQTGNPDFEDAIVAETALRERTDFIVTRNKADFPKSSIPAISPTDLIQRFA